MTTPIRRLLLGAAAALTLAGTPAVIMVIAPVGTANADVAPGSDLSPR